MRASVLVVASHPQTILGLAQAMLKFGYQIMTAYPEDAELRKVRRAKPSVVVVRPPTSPDEARSCLDLIKASFIERGVPVVACVSTRAEESFVRECLGDLPVIAGSPLRLNELYSRIQEMCRYTRRRELRITTEIMVAHRAPDPSAEAYYDYDTIVSLSMNGCFIRTENPRPAGSPIELLFSVGSSSRSLKATGRVCRRGAGPSGPDEGMGVAFEEISERDRSQLESFLMTQLGTAELPSGL